MADRIPTYIDTATQQITEIALGDGIDVTGGTVKADNVEVTNLTIDGTAYAPFDPADVTELSAENVKAESFTETVVPVEISFPPGPPNQNGPRYATADLSKANNFSMDFSGDGNGVYTFALTGAPSDAGDAYGCTLTLDTTGMAALTWSNVQWAGGVAPTLVADTNYVFTFITTDGGTSFKGFIGGQAFA